MGAIGIMTQSQINYFIAVAHDGSITRAANRLYVSQPAISKSISALEKELDLTLFSRRENALVLTYAGNQLYNFFIKSKDEYLQRLQSIRRHLSQISTQIRIGCPTNWNPDMFYDKITSHFSEYHPTVDLAVECYSIDELIAMLKNRQLDIILALDLHNSDHLGVECHPLATCNCGILYAKKVFCHASSIQDFKNIPFIGCDTVYREAFENIIISVCQNEFTPMFRHCSNYPTAMFELSRGNGIMLFNDWEFAVRSELFEFFPVNRTMAVNVMYLANHPNPLVASFAGELSGLFQDGNGHNS